MADDPGGSAGAVRRHPLVFRWKHVGTACGGCRLQAHARGDEGVGHRGRHSSRHRCDARRPGQAVAHRASDRAVRQQVTARREPAAAPARELHRSAHQLGAGIRALQPAPRPGAGGQRSPADRGAARRPAAALRDGDETGMEGGMRWVEPDDAKKAEGRNGSRGTSSGMSFPTSFGPAQRTLEATAQTVANAGARAAGVKTAKAVYTVPTNSTLMGSVAMTALIGRVPIDGTVNDPYPFKVLVGPDNLTANGIDIPDVAGAVFSGMASGDWTLSCVRGQVRSITFVFNDGTIRTIPEDREGNQQNNQQRNGLGWISDPYGIPCVSGDRRSNAQQYLGSQALITAAGAGVASLIKSDSGRMSYVGSDGSIGTVGISGQEAVGQILAGGVRDMSSWVNKLYGQAFAAIYVQPGAKVAVHLEKPLAIDYDPAGRRVDHRAGESHALELD
ncbi:MAG: TIGR03752 family integrating conjugative element protein [Burkholderiales bacterium]|nr:TIGR03752 family integrating conjugative element protein [Burkholderiales bacterium]